MIKKQQGFSILELMVSLTVGVFLLTGVLAVFSSMKTTAEQTSVAGRLQENGRLALNILTDDIMRQGFFGSLSSSFNRSSLSNVPGSNANDCIGEGINNESFPLAIGHFRTLWGVTVEDSEIMGCIDNAKIDSDLIQIKRVIAQELDLDIPADVASIDDRRYYLISDLNSGEIFAGDDPIPTINNGSVWEYQHHLYYIREDRINGVTIPILIKGHLLNTNNFFELEPIIDGIELLKFTYGVDTDDDGVVNVFLDADDMLPAYWDNENNTSILAVKIYILVRDLFPDTQYQNNNVYQIAGESFEFNDNFHRLLLSSTVTLHNAESRSW